MKNNENEKAILRGIKFKNRDHFNSIIKGIGVSNYIIDDISIVPKNREALRVLVEKLRGSFIKKDAFKEGLIFCDICEAKTYLAGYNGFVMPCHFRTYARHADDCLYEMNLDVKIGSSFIEYNGKYEFNLFFQKYSLLYNKAFTFENSDGTLLEIYPEINKIISKPSNNEKPDEIIGIFIFKFKANEIKAMSEEEGFFVRLWKAKLDNKDCFIKLYFNEGAKNKIAKMGDGFAYVKSENFLMYKNIGKGKPVLFVDKKFPIEADDIRLEKL